MEPAVPQSSSRNPEPPREAAVRRTLPKQDRLSTRREFDAVFKEGRLFTCQEFSVRILPNEAGRSRLGLLVGRRHGNAARRNRMKRLLREAFRLNRWRLTEPCDVVIVPRSGWRRLELKAIESVLAGVLERATEEHVDR